jgi:hypothetical protein
MDRSRRGQSGVPSPPAGLEDLRVKQARRGPLDPVARNPPKLVNCQITRQQDQVKKAQPRIGPLNPTGTLEYIGGPLA